MTRTVFTGGLVYDGTTAAPAEGDVVVEDGRIVDVGPGLDGDEVVDCSGGFVSPGFFDCHVHVVMDNPSFVEMIEQPFSLQFYKAAVNLGRPWTPASRACATRAGPTSASRPPWSAA